jgi:hypothetical protein
MSASEKDISPEHPLIMTGIGEFRPSRQTNERLHLPAITRWPSPVLPYMSSSSRPRVSFTAARTKKKEMAAKAA